MCKSPTKSGSTSTPALENKLERIKAEVSKGLSSPPAENFSFAGLRDKIRAQVKH